jgi:3-isopropylmalate/(R)-2-methylmalate dehydratase small subunit
MRRVGGDRAHHRSAGNRMMVPTFDGRARVFGDDVNTDYIIASTRKRDTLDESALKRYLLEAVDPAFAASVQPDDLIVAGANFGCGSAMEIAATVILAAGIKAVLAKSFSRTFYRNAVNNALLPIECDTSSIREGDRLRISFDDGRATVRVVDRNETLAATPIAPLMAAVLSAGGLVPYVRGGGYGANRGADVEQR